MRKIKFFMILLIVTTCLALALQSLTVLQSVHGAYTGTIYSKYSADTPILDGTINATEWANANVYEHAGQDSRFTVYLMHGENCFYLGISIGDDRKDTKDGFYIYFDEGDDGTFGSGSGDGILNNRQEDKKGVQGDGVLIDGCYHGDMFIWRSGQAADSINFEASMDYHENHWEAEFKIPFVGNDGHPDDLSDLNIDSGDAPGILIEYYAWQGDFSGYYVYSYPSDGDENHASTFLELKFDNGPPSIDNVIYTPIAPTSEEDVTVSASVIDDASGLKEVNLLYSADGGLSWSQEEMVGGPTYWARIPKQSGGTVQFKIWAEDNLGFTAESNVRSYAINDIDPPTISNISYTPKSPTPDDSVKVTALVIDNGSGVKSVTLRYSIDGGGTWTNVTMTSGSAYTATIPKQADGTTVQFKIYAKDNAGNSIESNVTSYTVHAPAPAIPGFPIEATLVGIVIAAIALTLLKKKQSIITRRI